MLQAIKKGLADPLMLLVFVGVGGIYAKMVKKVRMSWQLDLDLSTTRLFVLLASQHTHGDPILIQYSPQSEIFGVTHSNLSSFSLQRGVCRCGQGQQKS